MTRFRPFLLRQAAGSQRADDAHAIDVGLVVGRLHVFNIGPLFRVRVGRQRRLISEAQEQEGGFRLFDADMQAAAGMGFGRLDVETYLGHVGQRDAILNHCRAEIEFAQ